MPEIINAYLITFGWAIIGTFSMGLGIMIALKMFTWSTREINEWELVKQGNMSIALILAAVIIALGMVVSSIVSPN